MFKIEETKAVAKVDLFTMSGEKVSAQISSDNWVSCKELNNGIYIVQNFRLWRSEWKTIDVSFLPDGVYIFQYYNDEQFIVSRKVMVSHL